MPDERSRVTVVQALADKLGPEVAAALMECVPPFPWTEIATKTDLRELERRLDGRLQLLEERFDGRMERLEERFDGRMERLEERLDGRLEGFDGRLEGFDGRLEGVHGRIDGLRFELLAAIQTQATRTIKWTVGSIFAAIASVGGATAGVAALTG